MFAVFAGQTDGAFTAAGCDRKRFATEYAFELTPFRRRLAFMIADGMRAEAEERFVEQELAVHPQAA
jgi:hypothetical protein